MFWNKSSHKKYGFVLILYLLLPVNSFKTQKVRTSLEKVVKISIHVSCHTHCIKLSHAGFFYKQKS